MFKNLVKEYLDNHHTLEDLKNQYGIDSRISEDGMVIFSYSQIDSPKTDPIVRICRGLVLENNTWKILNYPFYRFYNFEEVLEERTKFNWDKAVATEKVDGSLISVFFAHNKWNISTRSMIGGENCPNDYGMTFNKIFDEALTPYNREDFFNTLNKEICYIFELVSPYNQIITEYPVSTLYSIGGRVLSNFSEKTFIDIYNETWSKNQFKNIIKTPKVIPLSNPDGSFKGFEEMKALAESVGPKDEGFVVVDFTTKIDGSFPRVKVKNSAYIALHHFKGQIDDGKPNFGEMLSIVYKNEQEEVIANLPQYAKIFKDIESKYNKFIEKFNLILADSKMQEFFKLTMNERTIAENKKTFAIYINSNFKNYTKFLFLMFNKGLNTFHDVISEMSKTKSVKDILKNLWDSDISKIEI